MRNTIYIYILLLTALAFLSGAAFQRYVGARKVLDYFRPTAVVDSIDIVDATAHLFWLAGQSNMQGAGEVDGYLPPPPEIARRIFVFNRSYQLEVAREPLSPSGIGPGVAFAAEYLRLVDDPDIVVVLVPAAMGGTNIEQWMPSKLDGNLYAEAVKRTLAASHLGQIEGVLFFQGENDAEGDANDHADDWGDMFTQLVEQLRSDLGDESLPIVFAQIGANTANSSAWDAVKRSQSKIDVPSVAMITTEDLSFGDSVHFTTGGYLAIGERFAGAAVRLLAERGKR
jgi:hypothetical protein